MTKKLALGAIIAAVVLAALANNSDDSETSIEAEPPLDAARATTTTAPRATTTSRTPTTAASQSDSSDAFKLAVIDSGNSNPSDSTVARYASALSQVEGKCRAQPGTSHGDYAVTATQILADEGIGASTLEILNGVSEALSEPGTESLGLQCSEVYALLVTLIVNG